MDIIRVEGVSKSYGDHHVLADLSLTIRKGECFTLLGPSGCGKTVLLRLIAGFESPDAGKIYLDDTLVTDPAEQVEIPPERRGIGLVFQDYAVWPHMTVFDNVAYPLKIAKRPKDEIRTRVMEMVEIVGMKGLEKRLPSELSGGQQQRVALARALVGKPSLLLLDEPLSNLDANLREEMRFEIKALQQKLNVTVLYVTHDQEIGLAISDRVAIMDEHGSGRSLSRRRTPLCLTSWGLRTSFRYGVSRTFSLSVTAHSASMLSCRRGMPIIGRQGSVRRMSCSLVRETD